MWKYSDPLLIPRRCKSQIFGDNYPSDDPEHFFREAIFVPYLDHLIVEMEDRFFDQKRKCRSLWGLIHKYCDASPNTAKDLESLLEIYQEDIGSRAAVVPELQLWVIKWKKEDIITVPSSAIEALCACHADIYPNVYILLTILGTLPVSTATSERSFNNMRRLITYVLSTMGVSKESISKFLIGSIPCLHPSWKVWSIPCLHPSWKVHTWTEICASLNHRKKTKAEGSRLIPRKHTETFVLLSVL